MERRWYGISGMTSFRRLSFVFYRLYQIVLVSSINMSSKFGLFCMYLGLPGGYCIQIAAGRIPIGYPICCRFIGEWFNSRGCLLSRERHRHAVEICDSTRVGVLDLGFAMCIYLLLAKSLYINTQDNELESR